MAFMKPPMSKSYYYHNSPISASRKCDSRSPGLSAARLGLISRERCIRARVKRLECLIFRHYSRIKVVDRHNEGSDDHRHAYESRQHQYQHRFPEDAVEAILKELLLTAAEADATLKGAALPSDAVGKAAAAAQLDLLEAVSLLCDIEPILKFELKDSLVRTGGYSSVNQAMTHLMPRIEKVWEKKWK